MHGIEVTGKSDGTSNDRRAQVRVRRITIYYKGDRVVNFVPESAASTFGQDDTQMVSDLLDKASQSLEWAKVGSQDAG